MLYQYMEVYKTQCPYTMSLDAPIDEFMLMFDWNPEDQSFVVSLFKDGEPLTLGEPLRYGVPLFVDTETAEFPSLMFIPWDKSGESIHDDVTWDNINQSVKIYLFEFMDDIYSYESLVEKAVTSDGNIGL